MDIAAPSIAAVGTAPVAPPLAVGQPGTQPGARTATAFDPAPSPAGADMSTAMHGAAAALGGAIARPVEPAGSAAPSTPPPPANMVAGVYAAACGC